MPALRVLDLANNQLTSLGGLLSANLPSLEELDLSHNRLSVLDGLTRSSSKADWDSKDATIEASKLVTLKSLKTLNMEDNRIRDCKKLQYLTTLTSLSLNHNCLSMGMECVFRRLRGLVELDVTENNALRFT